MTDKRQQDAEYKAAVDRLADPVFMAALNDFIAEFCGNPGGSYEDIAEALELMARRLRQVTERNR